MNWERFEELCREHNVSPTSVVIQCGCERSAVSRWKRQFYEKGGSNVTSETLLKISEYFHVTTDYLLGLSDKRTSDQEVILRWLENNTDNVRFSLNVSQLSSEDFNDVSRYVNLIKLKEAAKE